MFALGNRLGSQVNPRPKRSPLDELLQSAPCPNPFEKTLFPEIDTIQHHDMRFPTISKIVVIGKKRL